MAKNIISSYRAFEEAFDVPQESERIEALKKYFDRGGDTAEDRRAD